MEVGQFIQFGRGPRDRSPRRYVTANIGGLMDFLLNGRRAATDGFPAHTTLLEYLRVIGLTGAKEGCAEGECGACAVMLVSPSTQNARSEYRAINSCLVLLPAIAGHEVYTVEGLSRDGKLSEPQRAIAEGGGSQCGYCTPGFVVSLFAEYYRPGRTGACDASFHGRQSLPMHWIPSPSRCGALAWRGPSGRLQRAARAIPRLHSRHFLSMARMLASNAPPL